MKITSLALVVASSLFIAHSGLAAIVYQDDFNRTGALNGTSPNVDPSASVWNAASPFEMTGSMLTTTPASQVAAFLPVTLEANMIYTLSVTNTLVQGPGSTGWLGLGFAGVQDTSSPFAGGSPLAWMLANNGGGAQTFYGSAFGGQGDYSLGFSGTQTWSISLDTSTGTLTYAQNSVAFRTVANALNPAQIAAVTSISISSYDNQGTFDSVVLSVEPIPEPSVVALAIAGLGFVLLVARRRRAMAA